VPGGRAVQGPGWRDPHGDPAPGPLAAAPSSCAPSWPRPGSTRTGEIPDAEEAKNPRRARLLWEICGQIGLTRSDAVIGLGGGSVTDWPGSSRPPGMRGVRLVQVPNHAAGMVDAAVGGKTGINTAAGKNLVGAFYETGGRAVDLTPCSPCRPRSSGRAWRRSSRAVSLRPGDPGPWIEADPGRRRGPGRRRAARAGAAERQVKAMWCPPTCASPACAKVLNYVAHPRPRHRAPRRVPLAARGRGGASGLCSPPSWLARPGRLDGVTADRHRTLLSALGLPVSYPADALPECWRHEADKKVKSGQLRFVVVGRAGQAGPAGRPSPSCSATALRRDGGGGGPVTEPDGRPVLVLNGPNLGRLVPGSRTSTVPPRTRPGAAVACTPARSLGLAVGGTADRPSRARCWAGCMGRPTRHPVVLNAGAWTHYSIRCGMPAPRSPPR